MISADLVATRYAQAFFETVKAEGRMDEALEHVTALGTLVQESVGLRHLLLNPGVTPVEKVDVLGRVLGASWSELVRAFVTMVISKGRSESLAEIAEVFRELVDRDTGWLQVTVRSATPLPDNTLHRLQAILERRERKSIRVQTEVATELLGGLQVVLGHRLLDGSVRRQLTDLRQRLTAVSVA